MRDLLVLDDVEHAVEALAAHVADAVVFLLELQQLLLGEHRRACSARSARLSRRTMSSCFKATADTQRIARVGARPRQAAVAARALGDLRRGDGAADGEARGQPLAEGDDVGRDAVVLHRPHLAGAGRRELAFVEDQQRAPALGHLGESRQPLLGRHDHAARHRESSRP